MFAARDDTAVFRSTPDRPGHSELRANVCPFAAAVIRSH
jgi:hypothetical protein